MLGTWLWREFSAAQAAAAPDAILRVRRPESTGLRGVVVQVNEGDGRVAVHIAQACRLHGLGVGMGIKFRRTPVGTAWTISPWTQEVLGELQPTLLVAECETLFNRWPGGPTAVPASVALDLMGQVERLCEEVGLERPHTMIWPVTEHNDPSHAVRQAVRLRWGSSGQRVTFNLSHQDVFWRGGKTLGGIYKIDLHGENYLRGLTPEQVRAIAADSWFGGTPIVAYATSGAAMLRALEVL